LQANPSKRKKILNHSFSLTNTEPMEKNIYQIPINQQEFKGLWPAKDRNYIVFETTTDTHTDIYADICILDIVRFAGIK